MLDAMGMQAFAERARRELRATGETARKRSAETSTELTAQEAQIARLARDGLSNPEIGVRLFISGRTVQYHLKKVFAKLGISSAASSTGHCPATRTPPGGLTRRLSRRPGSAHGKDGFRCALADARAVRPGCRHSRPPWREPAGIRAADRQALPGRQAPRGLAGAPGRPDGRRRSRALNWVRPAGCCRAGDSRRSCRRRPGARSR